MLLNKLERQRKSQHGAALIAVLMILVVITLLGVTAMRMGLTGLTLATNSQISGLLFEAADKGMVDFKRAMNGGDSTASIATAMLSGGLVGSRGEFPVCVTPTGVANGLTAGVCETSKPSEYLSARQVSMSQVNYIRSPLTEGDTNAGATIMLGFGTGKAAGNLQDKLTIVSTAVIPAAGSATASTIDGCLALPSDDVANPTVTTVTDCLTDNGASFTTHADDFLIGINL